jgi:putative membrane protein
MVWWFVWMVLLFWIFIDPYTIPGQSKKRHGMISKKRLASGEGAEKYQGKKKTQELK